MKIKITEFSWFPSAIKKGVRVTRIGWDAGGFGWGEITFLQYPRGRVTMDSEEMSNKFVNQVLDEAAIWIPAKLMKVLRKAAS